MGGATVGLLRAALVTTQPANSIRVTSAALNGMVVPGPNSTAAWFEWGTSSSYGNTAGTNNLPAGSRVVPVKQVLIGLSADPVYHFRLVASNLLDSAIWQRQSCLSDFFSSRCFSSSISLMY
jgi:hypothetical protein